MSVSSSTEGRSTVSIAGSQSRDDERKTSHIADQNTPSQGTRSQVLSPELTASLEQTRVLGLKPWMVEFQKNLPELPPDSFSNAQPEKVVLYNLIWDVRPYFETKQLSATARYTYCNAEGNQQLILDASNLTIEQITVNGEPVEFSVEESQNPDKPGKLSIPIPPKAGLGKVSIQYQTSPSATGIFWVDKEHTNGKKYPLVYTLFESIEGASVIPGQHTPQVRLTYTVNVSTDHPDLMALSSVSNNPRARNEAGDYKELRMGRPVPLYLLSLHVGNFSFQPYDQKTGVYSENTMIDEVARTFSYLPRFMEAAEQICGPYNWGTYTPILLPWAFPYMAMEHPCASTCGQICLERPTVVPHELAHSWAGNDITNCNWQQFFWNEGMTCFIEYLICEKIWGTDHASMEFMNLLQEMHGAMNEYRESHPDRLRLCQQTDDFKFSRIPYGKGALFFFMLREALGREDFDRFFKDYMKVFYQNTMSDGRFLSFLQLWLSHEKGIKDFEQFKRDHKIDEWLYGTELPSNTPQFRSKLRDTLVAEKEKVLKKEPVNAELILSWDIPTRANFLALLIGQATADQLALLDTQIHFTQSQTMSIREEWARACAAANHITPETKEMIAKCVIERNSMHRANQISADLRKTPEGREVLAYILGQDQGRLFPVTRKVLEASLK